MAYVERRSRDRWRARYRGPDGRERSKTFARRIDAERFLAAMEHSKSIGAFVDPALGRVRLADWVHTWLQGAGPTVKRAESFSEVMAGDQGQLQGPRHHSMPTVRSRP